MEPVHENGSKKEDVSDSLEEQAHWNDVMRTMLLYSDFMEMKIRSKQEHLNRLPLHYVNRLPSSTFEKLNHLSNAMQKNQDFFTRMVFSYSYYF